MPLFSARFGSWADCAESDLCNDSTLSIALLVSLHDATLSRTGGKSMEKLVFDNGFGRFRVVSTWALSSGDRATVHQTQTSRRTQNNGVEAFTENWKLSSSVIDENVEHETDWNWTESFHQITMRGKQRDWVRWECHKSHRVDWLHRLDRSDEMETRNALILIQHKTSIYDSHHARWLSQV